MDMVKVLPRDSVSVMARVMVRELTRIGANSNFLHRKIVFMKVRAMRVWGQDNGEGRTLDSSHHNNIHEMQPGKPSTLSSRLVLKQIRS